MESHDDNILVNSFYTDDDEDIKKYESLFSNREFPINNNSIYIGNKKRHKYVDISRVYYQDTEEEVTNEKGDIILSQKRKILEKEDIKKHNDLSSYDQALQIYTHRNRNRPNFIIPSRDRYFLQRRAAGMYSKNIGQDPISYIPTQFLSMDLLASLWDKTVLTPYYNNVKRFLSIISEDFEDLAFIKVNKERGSRRNIERTGIIRLKGQNNPIPLNCMGDGVLRILQLVLGMYPAENGYLLIDEFENGLHYSVQKKIWELIFSLSLEMNIQVFSTTHSWDCIESFVKASSVNDIDAVVFRLGKSVLKNEKGKVIATVFEKDRLDSITQSDVEIR